MKEKATAPKSPFALALAARRGDVPPDSLTGAARRLFNDKSLSRDDLKEYANAKTPDRTKQFGRIYSTFKRG